MTIDVVDYPAILNDAYGKPPIWGSRVIPSGSVFVKRKKAIYKADQTEPEHGMDEEGTFGVLIIKCQRVSGLPDGT